MTRGPGIDEHELHAYVDGQLAPDRRSAVEAQLEGDPDAAARVEAYRRQNQWLHAALDPMLDEPTPARLLVLRPPARRPAWLRHGALAAALVLAAGLGWWLRGEAPARTDFGTALAQRAAAAHLVYVPEVLHPVEVEARQEQHLVAWLSKRLGMPLRAPHLQSAGFHLVGGRLLPGDDRPAAQFMYEDPQGRRLTLYLTRNADGSRATAFRYAVTDGVSTFYWIEDRIGYALTGELDRERLLAVAEAVYRQVPGR